MPASPRSAESVRGDENGISDFDALRSAIHEARHGN
jgi:hypothetical protein